MKKQIKIATLAGVAVLSAAAMAQATPAQLNIYGASAMGDFWVSEAKPFMSSLGCKEADGTTPIATGSAANGKITFLSGTKVTYGYSKGYNCTDASVPQDADDTHNPKWRNLEIRSGGIASLEGPLAVRQEASLENEADDCTNPGERKLLLGTTVTDSLANLGCYKVHVGAADLKVENINQSGTDENGDDFPMPDTSNFQSGLNTPDAALVVPFSPAVNTSVKARHCYNGTVKLSDYFCVTDADCKIYSSTATCSTTSETIDNLTRLKMNLLFAGKINNWQDFHKGFDNKSVKVCLRVPGSGTHAALDKMVMTAGGTGWGYGIAGQEDTTATPAVDYVKTSDNMVECVNGGTSDAGTAVGAVGYMDSDKGLGTKTGLKKINYDGGVPSRANIRNGNYDYYSVSQLYTKQTTLNTDGVSALYAKFAAFAKNPANIPGTICGSSASGPFTAANCSNIATNSWLTATAGTKAMFWATTGEMKFLRDGDLKYPSKVTPTYTVNP